MKFEEIVTHLLGRLMGRIIRRMIAFVALALLIITALYHLTVAADLALEELYGPLNARLIVVGAYAALAAMVFLYLFITRAKAPSIRQRSHTSRRSQDLQIAGLLESLLLGYTAARSKSRHS